MAGVVTETFQFSSGGVNEFRGGTINQPLSNPSDRYYIMETYNLAPEQLGRPVGKYDTIDSSFQVDQIKSINNMVVFTPLVVREFRGFRTLGFADQKSAVFKTIADRKNTTPLTLTGGVLRDVNPKELAGFHSNAFNQNQIYISEGTQTADDARLSEYVRVLGFDKSLDSYNGLNNLAWSPKFFSDSTNQVLETGYGYSDVTVEFKSGQNKYSSTVNLDPLDISFYKKVPLETVASLVAMLDWDTPEDTEFARLTPKSRFEEAYVNFLDSVGRLLSNSIPFAIVKAIDKALGPSRGTVPDGVDFWDNTSGANRKLYPQKYPILNPLSETINDDLEQVKALVSRKLISAEMGAELTANLNEEAKILRTIKGRMENDLSNIIDASSPTYNGNIKKGNVFGNFCLDFEAFMNRLYDGTPLTPTRNKPGKNTEPAKEKPEPTLVLGRVVGNQDEDIAAAFADNQIVRVRVESNRSNFFGAHEDFNQPMSVLDIIRDETQYPKSDNVTNRIVEEIPKDLDLCGKYFENLDVQATLDTISLLRLQLCGNLSKISTQMGKLKRLQFSSDFKLMSLFTGFKGISFENFGLPNFGNFNLPDFSLPNFGVPNLNLSDFGIPNIGLDLLTNLEIPNITLPNISFPDINFPDIPGIGGINIPKFQGFNFNWDDPLKNINDAKRKARGLSWPDLNLKVKLPKINWDPDLNLSALNSFSIPINCNLPINADIPIPKLDVSADFPCSLVADIKKIIENPEIIMGKMESAKKDAVNTLKKYEAQVENIQDLIKQNANIAVQMETLQKIVLEKQSEIQSQVAGQITATTNSVKDQLGNAVNNVPTLGNAQLERGRASLAKITGGVDSSSVVDTLKARLEV